MAKSIYIGFKKYKDRIDGVNHSITDEGNSVEINTPEDPEKEVIPTRKNQVIFKVQISASSVSINTSAVNFKGLSDVEQHELNGIYKYTVGNFFTFEEARSRQNDVRKIGFDSAFIVAYYNGEKITVQEGVNLTKENSE